MNNPSTLTESRAAELAQRIVSKYDDPELTDDVIELLSGVADPNGEAARYDAACAAVRTAYARTQDAGRAEASYLATLRGRVIGAAAKLIELPHKSAGAMPTVVAMMFLLIDYFNIIDFGIV